MYRRDLRDKPQSKIYRESIEQFGRELGNFFRDIPSVPVFQNKSDADLKDLREQVKTQNFALPFFTYRIMDLDDPPTDRGNRGTMRRLGKITNRKVEPTGDQLLDNPWYTYKVLNLTPTNVNMEVVLYWDYNNLIDFGPLWQQAAEGNFLNFSLFENDLELKFRVILNPGVSFYGDQDFSDNSFSRASTTATLQTYHGVVSEVKPATSTRINTGIVDHENYEGKQVQASSQITRTKSRVFKVKHFHEGEK